MKIFLSNDQTALLIVEKQVNELVRAVCHLLELNGDELHINFISKEAITLLHKDHFDDPTPTDCITFPIDGPRKAETSNSLIDEVGPHVIGEVFVCPRVAIEVSEDDPLNHPYEELSLYIVHTLLHLAGFNDIEEEETLQMRAEEKRLMSTLKEKNLLLSNAVPPINKV